MQSETCGVCMGDGRMTNAFGGNLVTCPSCHGSGRRSTEGGYRDVTKTKPSHHKTAAQTAAKQTWPTTSEGAQLAGEIRDNSGVAADAKARMIQEIIDHEDSHGRCTQTFLKKLRKQVRPAPR
jgi:DnaJ-class molecular chaperone